MIEPYDDLRAELAMIEENLFRASLTPAQEASSIARRKEIYVVLHPDPSDKSLDLPFRSTFSACLGDEAKETDE